MTRLLVLVVLLAASAAFGLGGDGDSSSEPAIKTVHLFNLASREEESRLLGAIAEFNELFVELGHRGIRYRVWKIKGRQAGDYRYLWDSVWPDWGTYKKVHRAGAYRALVRKHRALFERVEREHLYNRYEEVAGAGR